MGKSADILDVGHDVLVERAERYLVNTLGCGFAFAEFHGAPGWEIPDALGWKGPSRTILLECKANRSDFLSDQKKVCRQEEVPSMGNFRFYFAPKGMIEENELPKGWGLVEVREHAGQLAARRRYGPHGSPGTWSEYRNGEWYHEAERRLERRMMYSALRRLKKRGYLKSIYEQRGHTNPETVARALVGHARKLWYALKGQEGGDDLLDDVEKIHFNSEEVYEQVR